MWTPRVPRIGQTAGLVLVVAAALAGCGSSDSHGSNGSARSATTTASSPAASSEPTGFVSDLYGYSVPSADWSGLHAVHAWNGKGAPGDGDPTVDTMFGPGYQKVFGFGRPTNAELESFVAGYRVANAAVHKCSKKPDATRTTRADGEPAIVDENSCNGVFAVTAFVKHNGQVFVFFNYGQPADKAALRASMNAVLKAVSLQAA
jgi:hypothetical protein